MASTSPSIKKVFAQGRDSFGTQNPEVVIYDIDEGADELEDKNFVTVTLTNPNPKVQGFGLEISGGTDRPYLGEDPGIYVSGVKPGSIADLSGLIESGDKVIEVNGKPVSLVTHDEAVDLFIQSRLQVKLVLQKSYGLLLRAAQLTPTPSEQSVESLVSPIDDADPYSSRNHEAGSHGTFIDRLNMSVPGFMLGLTVGMISVILVRRLLKLKF